MCGARTRQRSLACCLTSLGRRIPPWIRRGGVGVCVCVRVWDVRVERVLWVALLRACAQASAHVRERPSLRTLTFTGDGAVVARGEDFSFRKRRDDARNGVCVRVCVRVCVSKSPLGGFAESMCMHKQSTSQASAHSRERPSLRMPPLSFVSLISRKEILPWTSSWR